jgi:hypothetical protein
MTKYPKSWKINYYCSCNKVSVIERRDFQGAQLLTAVVGSIARRATFGFFLRETMHLKSDLITWTLTWYNIIWVKNKKTGHTTFNCGVIVAQNGQNGSKPLTSFFFRVNFQKSCHRGLCFLDSPLFKTNFCIYFLLYPLWHDFWKFTLKKKKGEGFGAILAILSYDYTTIECHVSIFFIFYSNYVVPSESSGDQTWPQMYSSAKKKSESGQEWPLSSFFTIFKINITTKIINTLVFHWSWW